VEETGGRGATDVQVIETDRLREIARQAAEGQEASKFVEDRDRIPRLLAELERASDDFRGLSGPGDAKANSFAVDWRTVELEVQSDSYHGDVWWQAVYHVDEAVVWRAKGEATDPRSGDLLECRETE